jgi:signal transduction histidine kinase
MALDPMLVINDVLKGQAGEIERLRAKIHVDSGMPVVACHRAYLRQVFDNLISNALKFARPGEAPAVRIGAVVESNTVVFSVEDHGIGIPSVLRERVFRPFVRLMQSDAAGSGIGLAIVQRIIELYNGRVWIEGGEGTGCTVKFTMPWLREEGSAAVLEGKHPGTPEIVDVPPRGVV